MPKVRTSALKDLNYRQKLFVIEYASDLNPQRAAREAGYKCTKHMGSKLLNDPKIKKALHEFLEPSVNSAKLTTENILTQLANFLFFDLLDFCDDEGYLTCKLSDIPAHARQVIKGWDIDRDYDPETGEIVREKIKVRTVDKDKALELAMKYRNLLQPDQTTVQVNFWDQVFSRTAGRLPEVVTVNEDTELNVVDALPNPDKEE